MSFVSESFFFIYPMNLLSSLSVKGCKRIKEIRKDTRIPFNSKLYFGFHDYSMMVERFPEPAEAVASPRQSVEIYKSHFW